MANACSRCGEDSAPGQYYCRPCRNQYYRTYHKSPKQRLRRQCQRRVAAAVKSGTLRKPATCSIRGCDTTTVEAHHHHGYDYPLDVQWLCRKHHFEVDRVGQEQVRHNIWGVIDA